MSQFAKYEQGVASRLRRRVIELYENHPEGNLSNYADALNGEGFTRPTGRPLTALIVSKMGIELGFRRQRGGSKKKRRKRKATTTKRHATPATKTPREIVKSILQLNLDVLTNPDLSDSQKVRILTELHS